MYPMGTLSIGKKSKYLPTLLLICVQTCAEIAVKLSCLLTERPIHVLQAILKVELG